MLFPPIVRFPSNKNGCAACASRSDSWCLCREPGLIRRLVAPQTQRIAEDKVIHPTRIRSVHKVITGFPRSEYLDILFTSKMRNPNCYLNCYISKYLNSPVPQYVNVCEYPYVYALTRALWNSVNDDENYACHCYMLSRRSNTMVFDKFVD